MKLQQAFIKFQYDNKKLRSKLVCDDYSKAENSFLTDSLLIMASQALRSKHASQDLHQCRLGLIEKQCIITNLMPNPIPRSIYMAPYPPTSATKDTPTIPKMIGLEKCYH